MKTQKQVTTKKNELTEKLKGIELWTDSEFKKIAIKDIEKQIYILNWVLGNLTF